MKLLHPSDRFDKKYEFWEGKCHVAVEGSKLADAIAYGKGDQCFDFMTGKIVKLADCPEAETGESSRDLERGNRFIRIPTFDEMSEEIPELESHDDRCDEGAAKDMPDEDREHDIEIASFLQKDLAAEECALLWIASLSPSMMVGWLEEGLGVSKVYDPETHQWKVTR